MEVSAAQCRKENRQSSCLSASPSDILSQHSASVADTKDVSALSSLLKRHSSVYCYDSGLLWSSETDIVFVCVFLVPGDKEQACKEVCLKYAAGYINQKEFESSLEAHHIDQTTIRSLYLGLDRDQISSTSSNLITFEDFLVGDPFALDLEPDAENEFEPEHPKLVPIETQVLGHGISAGKFKQRRSKTSSRVASIDPDAIRNLFEMSPNSAELSPLSIDISLNSADEIIMNESKYSF